MSTKDDVNLGYSYHLPSGGLRLHIRNTLAQFSDLFSEFNKYISPAYHHDRCERSVHMRLYGMHKREFVLVFAGLFAMVGLATFIGLAGPPITVTTLEQISTNSSGHTFGSYILKTPQLRPYSQQLWVIGQIGTGNTDDDTFVKSFQVSVNVEGINGEHKPVPIVRHSISQNRSRSIECHQSTCQEFPVLHLGFLEYNRYVINVKLYGLESFHRRYRIKELAFHFKTYNPAFTQLEIWFRFIFLSTSFIAVCYYNHGLRRFHPKDWSLEQRWMSILLTLLLFFNNPIFPVTLIVESSLPTILDATSQTTFLCGLMMFWLCAYHGLRQNERRFFTFYLPKLVIVVPLWLTTVISAANQKIEELDDPTFNYEVQTNDFFGLKVAYTVAGTCYVLYILLLILRAYSDLRSMPYFDSRLRFLTMMMVIIVGVLTLLTLSKFSIDALQDNFVADLKTTYSTSAEFMTFYGLLNFALYAMAYVYSPTQNSPMEAQITKDNPAFSMINDSDEDVIYGSDEDRKPLNRSCNHDDSD